MTLSVNMVWEIRTTGDDTNNSGGFRGGAIVAPPAAPTVIANAGVSVAANTYYVVVTYLDAYGETRKSAQTSVVVDGVTNKGFTVTSPVASGNAIAWNTYIGTSSGGPYWLRTSQIIGTNLAVTVTPATTGTQAPGTDFSQQTTAQVNIDNSVITTSITGAVITFTGYTPTSADIGNTVRFLSGTNITVGNTYEIIAFTASTWTVDRAIPSSGTTINATAKMGGCHANLARARASMGSAQINAWVQAGTYNFSSVANGTAGRVTIDGSGTDSRYGYVIGYQTTRGDFGTKPIFQASSNTIAILTLNGDQTIIDNIEFQVNGRTGINGIYGIGNRNRVRRVKMTDCNIEYGGGNVQVLDSQFLNTSVSSASVVLTSSNASLVHSCYFSGGAKAYIFIFSSDGCVVSHCILNAPAAGNQFGGIYVENGSDCVVIRHCSVYWAGALSTVPAILFDGPLGIIENCVVYTDTSSAYGYDCNITAKNTQGIIFRNNACFANGALGGYRALMAENFVSLSGNPFTNAPGGDFSLNNIAGAGAACKSVAFPSAYTGINTTTYSDLGAVQQ